MTSSLSVPGAHTLDQPVVHSLGQVRCRLQLAWSDPQHFPDRVHHQPDELPADGDDDELAWRTSVIGAGGAEAVAEIDDGNDGAAEIDDAFDERLVLSGHAAYRQRIDDLLDAHDIDDVVLAGDGEPAELQEVAAGGAHT